MKKYFSIFVFIFFYITLPSQNITSSKKAKEAGPVLDSLIKSCAASIRPDSIRSYLSTLENFGTRFCLADNHRDVAVWIKNKYISLGYTNTVLDSFLMTDQWNSQTYTLYQYNVVATLEGTQAPDEIYIVGGHYDSYVSGTTALVSAPGVDDNGTSVAASLEVARAFKENNFHPNKTIKFIAFAAEELGLNGSRYYAEQAKANGDKIQMMINFDMIGTNHEAQGAWHINFVNYEGCENITLFAHEIASNYTTLTAVDVNSNSSGSDSYSFWTNGFPAIFLQEYEFSTVYHTVNDLLINVDTTYCAEITKVACGMLLQSVESPKIVSGLSVSDVGDGVSLYASWQKLNEADVTGYMVNVGNLSGDYDSTYYTTDTTIVVSGLTEGTLFYIGVKAVDIDGDKGLASYVSAIPLSIPRTPTGLEQLVSTSNIKLGWKKNMELDMEGYNIYRSDAANGTYEKINSAMVADTVYTDNTADAHTFYYYEISAVDSALNESILSAAIKTRVITHDMGILIVDDSEGGWLNPTDQQVDDFYNNICEGFTLANYDATDSTKIYLADMGAYSTLLWHINRKINKPVFYKNQNEVKKFLESGGNLLFTCYEPQGAAQNINGYPYTYNAGDFIYDYLKIASSEETDEGLFIGAKPFAAGYDSLYIDTLKTLANNQHHVFNIEAINPNSEGNTIYSYDSYFNPSVPAGNMIGKSVGVEYLGSDYKVVTLSVPLYFIKFDEAKNFVQYVMHEKFDEAIDVPEMQSSNGKFLFTLFPNPASDELNITINSAENKNATLEIYSISGKLIKQYKFNCSKGLQSKYIDITAIPEGFYFCKIKAGNNYCVKKLVVGR
ncbi:MAG TPA: M20/M25/M40 family metallo-hydrolase [Bacteroidales bacterium]|nr:M20/M25/M40 family metallo-hydrolase [Bacteroidales bacterium]HPS15639.1 M20/M25/M40 family metallo-hydrolase [Bacteroidales bacterium]